MRKSIDKGDRVFWDWGDIIASGLVINSHYNDFENTALKDKIGNGAKALLIQMEDGRKVVKMEEEVRLGNNSDKTK